MVVYIVFDDFSSLSIVSTAFRWDCIVYIWANYCFCKYVELVTVFHSLLGHRLIINGGCQGESLERMVNAIFLTIVCRLLGC